MDRAAWRLLGAALAAPLDSLFGEAAPRIHPVRLFGGLMEQLEELVWHDGVAAGAAYAAMGVGLGVLVGRVLACLRPGNGRSSLGRLTKRRLQGRELIASAAAAYVSVGARALFDSARDVSVALEAGDVDSARLLVSQRSRALRLSRLQRTPSTPSWRRSCGPACSVRRGLWATER